ncbi:MAG: pilus assembly protein TadG-related protein [Mesorhizobium sp.]
MLRFGRDFLRGVSGSFTPVLVIAIIPLVTVIGFSVDYTSAVTTKSNMQAALDAAILSITTLPVDTALADRQQKLQDSFAANSGDGTATLNSFTVAADGSADAKAVASFAMPTNFMQIARINSVQVGVASAVRKMPALVQATFKVNKVSGYWAKTMTLYGTKFGATVAKPMMTITYAYNGYGDPKGYGTTTVSTITNSGGADITTVVQKQVCTTGTAKSLKSLPAGSVIQTDAYGTMYSCADTMYPANGAGAVIDVSQMGGLYLQMDVPSGSPKVLKSSDPLTSNRLYVGDVEVDSGKPVDIFTSVPCGENSTQAWEDGGNTVPAPVANADFFYTVTGKCAFNQRPSETVLTQ